MEEMELIEEAKKRCIRLMERVERLDTSKITTSCKGTLLKLASSEFNFLSSTHLHHSLPLSVNIGHLEAVVHILEQPFITGVSRVCKSLPLSPAIGNGEKSDCCGAKGVYLDIVCTLNRNPVWFIVSDRNPKYVSWDEGSGNKGLRIRIQQVLDAARSSLTLKPSSVILFFSNGLDQCVCENLQGEFGAYECAAEFPDCSFDFLEEPESEWINVHARSYRGVCILEIKVDHVSPSVLDYEVKDSLPDAVGTQIPEKHIDISLGASFSSLILGMKFCSLHAEGVETLLGQDDLINFDTTALIAVVSGISNGGTEKLLAAPETEMRLHFKGNYKFVIAQVLSEIQNPIHVELSGFISGKRGIICETVHSEFKELVSMCGGPNEKKRADQLLKCVMYCHAWKYVVHKAINHIVSFCLIELQFGVSDLEQRMWRCLFELLILCCHHNLMVDLLSYIDIMMGFSEDQVEANPGFISLVNMPFLGVCHSRILFIFLLDARLEVKIRISL